jgi:hypothetical protein
MKLKPGDKRKVKSLKWFEENKNSNDEVVGFGRFFRSMTEFCSKEITIDVVMKTFYLIKEDDHKYIWGDFMLEEE